MKEYLVILKVQTDKKEEVVSQDIEAFLAEMNPEVIKVEETK